jgi:hypothetical protein
MSCNSGKITKKRIIILSTLIIAIAATIYAVSVATNNFAILVASPLVLGFLACPLMCGIMGGAIWLMSKLSKNKEKSSSSKDVIGGCCEDDHIGDDHRENKRTSNNNESIKHLANIGPKNKVDNSLDSSSVQLNSKGEFKIFPN